ncbi:ketoacyl-synt-domain-containing protein [Armillaria solidipes]|uniref:Ketoacyl-synt-domain-containing protein n=1 Tax=Armillaria solidipes TaxID=1076256 RepID=A0A2H3BBK7_9AGAR|nr:ketoacyl-synt-domain-containing protein [Armillaria solidipes]
MSPSLVVPVFAGHGTTAINSTSLREGATADASSPSGALLLDACHYAFNVELSTLSPSEALAVGIDPDHFKDPKSLLLLPSHEPYLTNSVVTAATLFLVQTLRYLASVQASSSTSFASTLQTNSEHGLGIVGFSSGILPACVVGSSETTLEFISNAVETFRLAFWIGVRLQIHKAAVQTPELLGESPLPWSLAFLGMSHAAAESAIQSFLKSFEGTPELRVTSVVSETSVTISGRPDILAAFAAQLPPSGPVHKTTVDALYHSSSHHDGVRSQVLADVIRRNIRFPTHVDIKVPVRSTYSGELLSKGSEGSASFVEQVVDMILTQPVNWDKVTESLVRAAPEGIVVHLLNFGPGAGLTKGLERYFPSDKVSSTDLSSEPAHTSTLQMPSSVQEPIAICGMSVNMPGAPSVAKLWEVLEKGINTVSEVPEHRFKVSDYNDPKKKGRTMGAHTGNFIDDPDAFDNKFFNISPREARSMDPQQRVLLHTAYEALEDAGYVPNSTPTNNPETFGCYVGVATNDYVQNLRNDIDVYYSTGTLRAFLSGRISYALQFSGPSIVVDTACSSSLIAVYQACRALMNRDCNAAVAGGVNVISSPDMFLGLDRGHFLSPTGQCKAFDASADGYSRSEGCGIFVLKRLSDAVAENDQVLGVIRGVEVNQSGNAYSITRPRAPTQENLFTQALERSGLDASRISVVEAHGTGTQAGDPIELESIRGIFAKHRKANNPLHITSVKANIGHLEAASGAAALAKLLLMLRHRTIPRLVSLKNLNPRIKPLASDNVIIDTKQVAWTVPDESLPRVALLNNFGAAGSNGALLLEEYIPKSSGKDTDVASTFIVGLSAKNEQALVDLRASYIEYLRSPASAGVTLADIAYTATARRHIFSHRFAVTARSKEELTHKLELASGKTVSDNAPGKVVFVFSGQGGQYLGMGSALYKTSALFKSAIDECESFLRKNNFPGVLPIINSDGESSGLTPVEEFEANQAAIFALEYGLAKLWMSWGVTPTAVVGHSLGEYAAHVIAGVLSLESALTLVAHRVRIMVRTCELDTTGMIAINLGSGAVTDILSSSPDFSGISIACYNSATDCVASGSIGQLDALKAHLDKNVHCKSVRLKVPFGYHSSAMQPLLEEFGALAKRVTVHAPKIPVISNPLGRVIREGDKSAFNAEYYLSHCADPVQFESGISALIDDASFTDIAAWIELGPHPMTLPMLTVHPGVSKEALLVGSLKKRQDDGLMLSSSLSQLYTSNVPVRWRDVFADVSAACVSLPSYPWQKSKFWVAWKEDSPAPASSTEGSPVSTKVFHPVNDFGMLQSWAQFPSAANSQIAIFETPISLLKTSITGHIVGDVPLCPASVYHELALAGIEASKVHLSLPLQGSHSALFNIDYVKPLVYSKDVARVVKTTIAMNTDGSGTFTVESYADSEPESVHCSGQFRPLLVVDTTMKFNRMAPVVSRRTAAICSGEDGEAEVFTTRTAYEIIFTRVVRYAKEYHTMKNVTISKNGMEGYAVVKLPKDHDKSKFVVHPVFMDTMLHVAGFLANMQGGDNDAYICSKVKSVKAVPSLINNDATYGVFVVNAWVESEGMMLSDAIAVDISGHGQIVAQLKGMCFKKLRLNTLQRSLTMHAGHTAPAPAQKRSVAAAPKPKITEVAPALGPRSSPAKRSVDVQNTVLNIVGDTCGIEISALDVNADLETYGVDSLMSIEILRKFEESFPQMQFDATIFSTCNNITELVREISSTVGSQAATAVNTPETASTPEPTLQGDASQSTDVRSILLELISSFTGFEISSFDLNADADTAYGLDKFLFIPLFSKLQTFFPDITLDPTKPSVCSTIGELLDEVTAQVQAGPSSSSSDLVDTKPMFVSVLGLDESDIQDDTEFETIGLDSLTAIEALHAIQTEYGLELPSNLFELHTTAKAVNQYISSKRPGKSPKQVEETAMDPDKEEDLSDLTPEQVQSVVRVLRLDEVPMSVQKSSSSGSPLFLFHDGSGAVNYLRRLGSVDREFWGFNNPNYATGKPWGSVEAMASAYADYAVKVAGSRPVIFGGWSFGGVVGFEAARQLMRRGIPVKGVVLIDSPFPVDHVPSSNEFMAVTAGAFTRGGRTPIGRMMWKQLQQNAPLLKIYDPRIAGGPYPPLVLLHNKEGIPPDAFLPYPVPRWMSEKGTDPCLLADDWSGLVGAPIKVIHLPGTHFTTFATPHLGAVTEALIDGCAYLDGL